eukprot:gene25419-33175_t
MQCCSSFTFPRRFGKNQPLSCTATTNEDIEAYNSLKTQIKSSLAASGRLSPSLIGMMSSFLDEYTSSNIDAAEPPLRYKENIVNFFKNVQYAIESPYQFQPFHQAIRSPFDYYSWGNDFLRPLVILQKSKIEGAEYAQKILKTLERGENVIILSNHQTEADPQVLSILLESVGLAQLAEQIIFIAGHKVTNDPVAIPFSMGRNLLCIHSKKHIKNPPEDMARKSAQNLESMKAMGELLANGGKIFWVAPSGGRDRPDPETQEFKVAPFDAKALDMFKLVAMQSKKPMHFFPMAMYTHQLVPPPKSVSSDLGEERSAKRGVVSVSFLDETDGLGGLKDKEFTQALQSSVEREYQALSDWHKANE